MLGGHEGKGMDGDYARDFGKSPANAPIPTQAQQHNN